MDDIVNGADVMGGGELVRPHWVQARGPDDLRLCLRVASPFAALVATGLRDFIGVCELGKLRSDLQGRHLWSIGWGGDARPNNTRSDSTAHALMPIRDDFLPQRFQRPSRELLEEHAGLEPQSCEQLLSALRLAISKLMPRYVAPSPEDQETFQNLHNMVASLQVFSDRVRGFRSGRALAVGRKYNVVQLVNAFWACGYLKADGSLREASCWVLRTCLPSAIVPQQVHDLQTAGPCGRCLDVDVPGRVVANAPG